jgi:hypothetical protein
MKGRPRQYRCRRSGRDRDARSSQAAGPLFRLAGTHPTGNMMGLCRRCLKQQTASQMRRLTYLLVLLLMAAQVDDAWAVAPVLPSAALADDDNEYLPAQRRPQEQLSSSRQKPVSRALAPRTADFSFAPRGVLSRRTLTPPFAPTPLYVFMSLQI